MSKLNIKVHHYPLSFQPVHLTYRLADSIPKAKLFELKQARHNELQQLEKDLVHNPHLLPTKLYSKQRFAIEAKFELAVEEVLHKLKSGPYHLSDPRVARLIMDSWSFLQEEGEIFIYCLCVMGNHVHLILRSKKPAEQVNLAKLINRHKAFTAIKANKLLGKTGAPFWDHFYFDRTIRQGKFTRAMWYVLNNPVTANLTDDWRKWEWTYLNPEYNSLFK